MSEGIEWSVPVIVEKRGKGRLMVSIPDQAIERLGVVAGDIVCYTAFANGGIEFWSVKKSPYTSLDTRAKPKKKPARKGAKR